MVEWLKGLKEKPGVAHLMRAGQRFTGRLGNQFGAAITYFSVLALVPIVMFAFAITGFILVVVKPELMQELLTAISGAMGDLPDDAKNSLLGVVENALTNYASIGIIGLLSAAYAGAGWVGNLKSAVRAQWRPDFDMTENKKNIVVETLLNLVILVGLLLMIAITFALSSLATSMTDVIISWLRLDEIPGIGFLLRFVPIIVSIGAGWLLFMFIYTIFPEKETEISKRAIRRGALIGAVGLALLQYLFSFLIGMFTGNPAAALFGPVIALMLFFNLFARLILFVAAWIATATQAALSTVDDDPLVADAYEDDVEPSGAESSRPDADRTGARDQTPAGVASASSHRASGTDAPSRASTAAWTPENQHTEPVSQTAAQKAVKIGMGAGYVTGAATGVGLGALVAAIASKVTKRR